MLRTSLIIFVLLIPVTGWAQHKLSGQVVNKATGKTLAGAHIKLKGTYKSTASNPDGQFTISNVQSGTYSIVTTFIGFQKQVDTIEINQNQNLDIVLVPKSLQQDEVLVEGTRVDRGTPTTYTNINREAIEEQNDARNMPSILENEPSVFTTSNGGAGVGYSDIRIRGSSSNRTNVTINGVPLNDAESHGVYWVNIPDIASATESIQVQRGVGTSTNGAGAFGATVNLRTSKLRTEPYGKLTNSFGSFNTRKHSLQFGTGLIDGKWTFDGSLSKINSDGYIDRASSDLKSYYLSGGYYGENTIVKAITFSGRERTYQAWYGVLEDSLGKQSSNQSYLGELANLAGGNHSHPDSRNYNAYDYENQVDNYGQDHYQLHISHEFNRFLNASAALHYTHGEGYYEQYRPNEDLQAHDIQPPSIKDSTIRKSDLVKRRWLDNDFYGATYSLTYNNHKRLKATLGGAWNKYEGEHFGTVIWSRYAGDSEIGDRFYDNTGTKTDFNIYGKANYQLTNQLSVYGDFQYRSIDYEMQGIDYTDETGNRTLNQSPALDFINPKLGLDYRLNSNHSFYAFLGIANREPTRSDYVDAPDGQTPESERLRNVELGYELKLQNAQLTVNGYLMDYKNQLVRTGEVNDVGRAIRTNVPNSYRSGVELAGEVDLSEKWQWQGNLTLSRNKIEEIRYKVGGEFVREYENTDIAYSPNLLGSSQMNYLPFKNFKINLQSKYVGEQYLDNTSRNHKKLDDYLLNSLNLQYKTLDIPFMKSLTARVSVNNLLDVMYAPDGYVYSYRGSNNEVVDLNYYYPQAGRNYMGTLSFKF